MAGSLCSGLLERHSASLHARSRVNKCLSAINYHIGEWLSLLFIINFINSFSLYFWLLNRNTSRDVRGLNLVFFGNIWSLLHLFHNLPLFIGKHLPSNSLFELWLFIGGRYLALNLGHFSLLLDHQLSYFRWQLRLLIRSHRYFWILLSKSSFVFGKSSFVFAPWS